MFRKLTRTIAAMASLAVIGLTANIGLAYSLKFLWSPILDQVLDGATVGLCAEMLGNMRTTFEMTLDYLKTRKQFGQAIGEFQGIHFMLADMAIKYEATRLLMLKAAWLVSRGKLDGRSSEIQRLIGRSLRAGIDLVALGPRTAWVDCDVLQADGGTRTAAITGAYVALAHAAARLQSEGKLASSPLRHAVAVDQQVDQHDRAEQAEHQPGEGALHGPDLALDLDRADARRLLRRELGHDGADVGGDGAEVAALHAGIDLHHVLQVVLRDHRIADVAADIGDTLVGAQRLQVIGVGDVAVAGVHLDEAVEAGDRLIVFVGLVVGVGAHEAGTVLPR